MKRPWSFVTNPFLTATENSYRMAVRISTWHYSALNKAKGNPFILPLFNSYEPLHAALVAAFNTWVAQGGLQTGETLNLNQLLRLLRNSKVNKWSSMAGAVHDVDSPRYKALFPRGHAPFQTGSQTERFTAVLALIDTIGAEPALATLLADVTAFNTQLTEANTNQKGSQSKTNTDSDAVDKARKAMGVGQYSNLGAMMSHWAETPENIEEFFALNDIRNGQQIFFDHQVKPLKVDLMVKHTFSDGDEIALEKAGPVDLIVYNADAKGKMPNGTSITLKKGDRITIPASNLGPLTNAFVLAYNPDPLVKGQLILEIL